MSKVVIGCKMPNGILLEIGNPGDAGYQSVVLKGANEGERREGGIFVPHTVGGFGRTTVDAKFWNDWSTGADIKAEATYNQKTGALEASATANRDAFVKARKAMVDEWQAKGLVFVVESPELAVAQGNEKASVTTGFEPLAQAGDKRAPRNVAKAG